MVAASSTNVGLGPSRAVCGRFAFERQRLVLRDYRVISLAGLGGAEWAARAELGQGALIWHTPGFFTSCKR